LSAVAAADWIWNSLATIPKLMREHLLSANAPKPSSSALKKPQKQKTGDNKIDKKRKSVDVESDALASASSSGGGKTSNISSTSEDAITHAITSIEAILSQSEKPSGLADVRRTCLEIRKVLIEVEKFETPKAR